MSDHEYLTPESEYESENDSDLDVEVEMFKWPLEYTWVMYDHAKSDSETYEACTRKICEINSVIKFWQVLNHYPKPSKLFNNGVIKPLMNSLEISSISFFKRGILPKWEDKVNLYGAEISKRKFNKKNTLEELDSNWFDILIACTGSMIDPSITGIRVVDYSSIKKNDFNGTHDLKLFYRIELWFDNPDKKVIIEEQFKSILNIDDNDSLHYKPHNINITKN